MSPEALRRRMAHGNIYPPERVDAALANYFRPGNLAALRELALLWVADRVEEDLQSYMEAHGIADSWETRERVVVAITGAPGRRAARAAGGPHRRPAPRRPHRRPRRAVRRPRQPRRARAVETADAPRASWAAPTARSSASMCPSALVEFARGEKATQIVLGASRRSRWQELVRGSVVANDRPPRAGLRRPRHRHRPAADEAADSRPRRRRRRRIGPSRNRQIAGWLLTAGRPARCSPPSSSPFATHLTLATDLLLFLVVTVVIAAIGGLAVAIVAAVGGVPARRTGSSSRPSTRSRSATPRTSSRLGGVRGELAGGQPPRRPRRHPQPRGAAGPCRGGGAGPDERHPGRRARPAARISSTNCAPRSPSRPCRCCRTATTAGWSTPQSGDRPAHGAVRRRAVGPRRATAAPCSCCGAPQLTADDQRVLRTFLSQPGAGAPRPAPAGRGGRGRPSRRRRRAADRAAAGRVARPAHAAGVDQGVGHQPAAVRRGVDAEQRREFAATIDAEADRLNRVVGNLLDMSRLQAGAVTVVSRPVYLEDVVAAALATVDHDPHASTWPCPRPCRRSRPTPRCSSGRWPTSSPTPWRGRRPRGTVRVEAAPIGGRVHLRVIDRGPGVEPARPGTGLRAVPAPRRPQHPGRRRARPGRGPRLRRRHRRRDLLDDTPGGGLTVVFDLPSAAESASDG